MTRQQTSNRYGPGDYSDNGLYWHDGKTGILYHVHAIETEECEVQGADRGVRWRKSTLSRLVRAPAIVSCRFDAVTDDTAQVAGSVSFSRHARHGGRHLDDLDSGTTDLRTTDLRTTDMSESLVWAGDRQRAAAALARLDSILEARGWKPRRESGAHWYSWRYRRPVILWDQPVHAAEMRGQPGGARPTQ
jgi:hypothetical protein